MWIKLYLHHEENPHTKDYFLHNINNYTGINYEFTNDWTKRDGIHVIDYKFYCIEKKLSNSFVGTCQPHCYDNFFNHIESIDKTDDIKIHLFLIEQELKKSTIGRIARLDKKIFTIFWDKIPSKDLLNPYNFLFTQTFKIWMSPMGNGGLDLYKPIDAFKNSEIRINFPVRTKKAERLWICTKIKKLNNPKFTTTFSNPEWGEPDPNCEINASINIKENNLLYLEKIIPISQCTLVSESVVMESGFVFLTEKTIGHIIIGKPFILTSDHYKSAFESIFDLKLNSYWKDLDGMIEELDLITKNDNFWSNFIENETRLVNKIKDILEHRINTINSYLEYLLEDKKESIRNFL